MVNKNITRITWSTLAVSNCKLLYVCTSAYIIEYCKYARVDIDIVAIPEVRHSRGLLPLAVAVRVSPDVGAWLGPHILVAVLEAVGPAQDDCEAGARTGLEPGELPGVLVRGVAGDLTPGAGGGSIGLHLQVFSEMTILFYLLNHSTRYLPLYLQYRQNGVLTHSRSILVTIK